MIAYLMIFTSVFILGSVPLLFRKKKKIIRIFATLLPILILYLLSVLKDDSVGIDTQQYLLLYNEAVDAPLSSIFSYNGWEPLFSIFLVGFSKLHLPFRLFQAFIYLLVYLPLFFFMLKFDKAPGYSLLIFCFWSILIFNFSGLRQAVAMSFCLLSIIFLNKRKILGVVIGFACILIGCLFHITAITFFIVPLLFLFKKPLKLAPYLIILSLFIFCFSPLILLFVSRIIYSTDYVPILRPDAWETFFAYLLIAVFIVFCLTNNRILRRIDDVGLKIDSKITTKINSYNKIFVLEESNDDSIFSILVLVFLIGTFFEAFILSSYAIPRISMYFTIIAPFSISHAIGKFKSTTAKLSLYVLIGTAFMIYFYFTYISPNYLNCVPYTFFFQN